MSAAAIDSLIDELGATAAALRAGDIDAAAAAALVERCAEIAGRLGAELDRYARGEATEGARHRPAPVGQEELL